MPSNYRGDAPRLSYDPEVDGVTNSLMSAWNGCRELARINLHGITSRMTGLGLTYGTIGHWILQHLYEDFRAGKMLMDDDAGEVNGEYLNELFVRVAKVWHEENFGADQYALEKFEFSIMSLRRVMPFYVKHWWQRDFVETTWVGLESEFKVPFEVHRRGITYRTFLRGKRDGLFIPHKRKKTWLFETKFKTRIDEGLIVDILPYESQVNTYVVAGWLEDKVMPEGVRYNIVRRPGLRQKKNENAIQFAQRFEDDVMARPNWYFLRQNMLLDKREVDRYLGELEDKVWEFIHWWNGKAGHWKNSDHCENKYGQCPCISICSHRDYKAFFIRDRVFRELEDY